jgi:hypothetical protein
VLDCPADFSVARSSLESFRDSSLQSAEVKPKSSLIMHVALKNLDRGRRAFEAAREMRDRRTTITTPAAMAIREVSEKIMAPLSSMRRLAACSSCSVNA